MGVVGLVIGILDRPSLEDALAWADRLYYEAGSPDGGFDVWPAETALDAFRQVAKQYGSTPRVQLGVARCLAALGHYREAANILVSTRGVPAAEIRDCSARADVATRAQAILTDPVHQVLPMRSNGKTIYAVLSGRRLGWQHAPDVGIPEFTDAKVTLFQKLAGQWAKQDLKVEPDSEHSAASVTLRVGDLTGAGEPFLLVAHHFPGADNDSWRLEAFSPLGKRLANFGTMGGYHLYRMGSPAHSIIEVVPTWKIWWSDLLEWRRGQFQMATRQQPQLYREDFLAERRVIPEQTAYGLDHWLRLGAFSAIESRFGAADSAYHRAERICEKAVQAKTNSWPDWSGERQAVLKEVRLRLAWLRKGDYSHDLLYRPCNLDWQVKPQWAVQEVGEGSRRT